MNQGGYGKIKYGKTWIFSYLTVPVSDENYVILHSICSPNEHFFPTNWRPLLLVSGIAM